MIDHLLEVGAIPAFIHESARPPKAETDNASCEQSHILIFCTSLQNGGDVRKIAPLIEGLPGMLSWSVDLEDCDKVLRVVSEGMRAGRVIDTLRQTGFNIHEMPD